MYVNQNELLWMQNKLMYHKLRSNFGHNILFKFGTKVIIDYLISFVAFLPREIFISHVWASSFVKYFLICFAQNFYSTTSIRELILQCILISKGYLTVNQRALQISI